MRRIRLSDVYVYEALLGGAKPSGGELDYAKPWGFTLRYTEEDLKPHSIEFDNGKVLLRSASLKASVSRTAPSPV